MAHTLSDPRASPVILKPDVQTGVEGSIDEGREVSAWQRLCLCGANHFQPSYVFLFAGSTRLSLRTYLRRLQAASPGPIGVCVGDVHAAEVSSRRLVAGFSSRY